MCNKKGCTINNFPLKLVGTKTEVQVQEFNNELIQRFLKKIDLKALTSVSKDVKIILKS
jgi:multifunctional methyltransferase subunit TRM112